MFIFHYYIAFCTRSRLLWFRTTEKMGDREIAVQGLVYWMRDWTWLQGKVFLTRWKCEVEIPIPIYSIFWCVCDTNKNLQRFCVTAIWDNSLVFLPYMEDWTRVSEFLEQVLWRWKSSRKNWWCYRMSILKVKITLRWGTMCWLTLAQNTIRHVASCQTIAQRLSFTKLLHHLAFDE